jgi:hypothetical protein
LPFLSSPHPTLPLSLKRLRNLQLTVPSFLLQSSRPALAKPLLLSPFPDDRPQTIHHLLDPLGSVQGNTHLIANILGSLVSSVLPELAVEESTLSLG